MNDHDLPDVIFPAASGLARGQHPASTEEAERFRRLYHQDDGLLTAPDEEIPPPGDDDAPPADLEELEALRKVASTADALYLAARHIYELTVGSSSVDDLRLAGASEAEIHDARNKLSVRKERAWAGLSRALRAHRRARAGA